MLDGLSIGFKVNDYEITEGGKQRRIKSAELFEVSLVTFPANEQATITSVKSDQIKTIRDYERALRDDLGYTADQAKALASGGYKALGDLTRDVDGSTRDVENTELKNTLLKLKQTLEGLTNDRTRTEA